MNHQEILTKAIEKVIGNGWKPKMGRAYDSYWPPEHGFILTQDYGDFGTTGWHLDILVTQGSRNVVSHSVKISYAVDYEDLIFSHEFAKALWPEYPEKDDIAEELCYLCGAHWSNDCYDWCYFMKAKDIYRKMVFAWQYHLQQMAIAEDPIKYLGENI